MPYADQQARLANAIRHPEQGDNLGVESRRLAIYQSLFFNNLDGFISNTFPVLKTLFNEDDWLTLVRHFFQTHSCETPFFLQISQEFLIFLNQQSIETDNIYQWLSNWPEYGYQLAHWEWMELYADSYANQEPLSKPIEGDLAEQSVQPIETAWVQAYDYPVHKIQVGMHVSQEPTYLMIYRDATDNVGFVELNPLSYVLFEKLQQQIEQTCTELLVQIAQENKMDNTQVVAGGLEILNQWNRLGILRHNYASLA